MKIQSTPFRFAILIFVMLFQSFSALSQSENQKVSERAIMALEKLILDNDPSKIDLYLKKHVQSLGSDSDSWRSNLHNIIKAMHELDGGVGVYQDGEALVLNMSNQDKEQAVKLLFDQATGKVTELFLMDAPEQVNLDPEDLEEAFNELESEGYSGIIYVKMDNKIVLKRAFGMSDRSANRKNNLTTIFGTGSRPIDYTVAAILLLDQQGALSINDPITKYIKSVPSDKTKMTITQLMTGQSGLPDFFDIESDWDADLAWVDRETAVRRMMAQKLLFEPGKGRSHSHGAFGLLAAIVEYVSGQSYYSFIREKFLDPAGMARTGEYGETRGLTLEDFAVGGGQQIGLPNIPPNWGPTSWLVKGSGGMYSTLGDLQKFYKFIRTGDVFDQKHRKRFLGSAVNIDGSVRGFELFSLYESPGDEVYLFLNEFNNQSKNRSLMRALENLY